MNSDGLYRNILVPLENSAADEAILEHIRKLARIHGSRLLLCHVADGFAALYQDQLNLADSEEMVADRTYLEQRCTELTRDGFTAAYRLAQGSPAPQILAIAEAERCDLIAMSTHGHGFIKDVILGSVAENVRHRTDIPVLLVRAKPASAT